ncbi:NAD(P)/FAD-dependent oxidoreductase [Alicyclobacillus sp. SO9]|uniref:phytoene desaturase family protein n=1 Tax=Alicyclobacillus sp. SO9 TaxID=2665646 RepID=UPI0018E70263|nr:NAD(P)/FAD-dependent oxidoreductase [Alicyclobacillus sp. SO9]QQE80498.1 NAD(P)/FAD-dependent oxidoreductase [Alicyclobacillus sp. SO9]
MFDTDIIVIGSGHNGLAAALILAKAGLKVTVLEQSNVPGGAAKTAELTLPGLKHDLYATNIGLFLGSQVYSEFGTELHQHGLEIAASDKPFASVFPDNDAVRVSTDSAHTRAEFARQSEGDAESWEELLNYFKDVSSYLLPILQLPMPSVALARHLYRTYRYLGRERALDLIQLILKSPRQFAEQWFTSEKIRSLFIPWGFHLDYGPDVAGGALFPFIEVPMDFMNGMALAKGGVGNLISAMVQLLESMGGQLVLNTEVKEIIIRQNKAVGVRTTNGNNIVAKRGVLANVTPSQLIKRLIPPEALPSQYVKKMQKFRYGPGTMMIHLAMDGPLQWNAGSDLQDYCYVHIGPYIADVARTYTECLNGTLPGSPMLVVGQQSMVDASRSANGKHTLWIQVRAVPSSVKNDAFQEIKPSTWSEMKEPFADRVLQKVTQYAPNLKDIVLDKRVLSPWDLQVDNPNLEGGDSVSGSHHLDQNYIFRPFPGWSKHVTPIRSLYLCGASTWPGGGLNAASGYLAAQQILKRR